MQITIKKISGETLVIDDVKTGTTIGELKHKIQAQSDIPVDEQFLVYTKDYRSTELLDNMTVGNYPDVINDSTIYLCEIKKPTGELSPLVRDEINQNPIVKWMIHIGVKEGYDEEKGKTMPATNLFDPFNVESDLITVTDHIDDGFFALTKRLNANKSKDYERRQVLLVAIEVSNDRLSKIEKDFGKSFGNQKFGEAMYLVREYAGFELKDGDYQSSSIKYNIIGYFEAQETKFISVNQPLKPENLKIITSSVFSIQERMIARAIKNDKEPTFNLEGRALLPIPEKDDALDFLCGRNLGLLYKFGFNKAMLEFIDLTFSFEALEQLNKQLLQEVLTQLIHLENPTEERITQTLNTQEINPNQKKELLTIFKYYHTLPAQAQNISNSCGDVTSEKGKDKWTKAFLAFLQFSFPDISFGPLDVLKFQKENRPSLDLNDLKISVPLDFLKKEEWNVQSEQKASLQLTQKELCDERSWDLLTGKEKSLVFAEALGKDPTQSVDAKKYWGTLSLEKQKTFIPKQNLEKFEEMVAEVFRANNPLSISNVNRNQDEDLIVVALDHGGVLDGRSVFKGEGAKLKAYEAMVRELSKKNITKSQKEEILKEMERIDRTPIFSSDLDIRLPESIEENGYFTNVLCNGIQIFRSLDELKRLGCKLVGHSRNKEQDQLNMIASLVKSANKKGVPYPIFNMLPVYDLNKYGQRTSQNAEPSRSNFKEYDIQVYGFGGSQQGEAGKSDVRDAIRTAYPGLKNENFFILDDGLIPNSDMLAIVRQEGCPYYDIGASYSLDVALNEIVQCVKEKKGKELFSNAPVGEKLEISMHSNLKDDSQKVDPEKLKVKKYNAMLENEINYLKTHPDLGEMVEAIWDSLPLGERAAYLSLCHPPVSRESISISNYQNNLEKPQHRSSVVNFFNSKQSNNDLDHQKVNRMEKAAQIINEIGAALTNLPKDFHRELEKLDLNASPDEKMVPFFEKLFSFLVYAIKNNQESDDYAQNIKAILKEKLDIVIRKPLIHIFWNPQLADYCKPGTINNLLVSTNQNFKPNLLQWGGNN